MIAGRPAGDGAAASDGAGATDVALSEVRGIWFHPRGGFFLATHAGNRIWYVDATGHIHVFVEGGDGHAHAGDGKHFRDPEVRISEPRGVTMNRAGNVIITENDFGYVRVVRLK